MGTSSFVGRVEPLQRLGRAFASATSGVPQVVAVEATAGMGKSALLTEFCDGLDGGHRLLGSGDEVEATLRFGLLEQLLQTRPAWADPFNAGAALLQQVGRLPGDGPVVIVVDDAHWSDLWSLQALNFMVRRLRSDPVLLVLAYRPEQAFRLPVGLVQRADAADSRVPLGGLTGDEIQELASALGAGPLTDRAAARLHGHTGGNPLHLRALLRELRLADLEALDRPLPAPRSFALLVINDLAGASTSARRVASAAAVLGDQASVSDILALAEIDRANAPDAFEELTRVGILRFPAGETQVRFVHPLVRAAIYDDLGPGMRCQLHERAAHLMSGLPALRHRVSAAIVPEPGLATDLETEGDAQVRAGQLSVAAEAWLAAARLGGAPAETERRLLTGVDLLLRSGDVAAALGYADRIDAIEPTAQRLYLQSRMAWLTGQADHAVRLGKQAWDQLSGLGPGERDQLAAMLAQIEVLRDHGAEAARWAATALVGGLDPDQAPLTRSIQAQGLFASGNVDAALRVFGDLPRDPRLVDPRRHAELTVRGVLRAASGDLARADADLMVAGSVLHGDLSEFRLIARAHLALARFRAGDWTSANVVAEEVVSLAADMEQHWIAGYVHAIAAMVPAGRGEWETAQRHADKAARMAAEFQDPATGAYADDAAVFLATCRGEPADVVSLADSLRRGPLITPHEPGLFTWPVHLVSALVELGRLDEAEDELARVEDLARRRAHPTRLAAVARLHGQLANARGNQKDARAAFETAIARGDDRVDADERAIAHLNYARFLRRRGERRAAVAHLVEARRRYGLLAAGPFIARCDDLLSACGVQGPGQASSVDVLTPQERAVAALICAGRTNRQAAEELVVSPKTIGYHLANAYTKLGVHSRAQLVVAMQRLGS